MGQWLRLSGQICGVNCKWSQKGKGRGTKWPWIIYITRNRVHWCSAQVKVQPLAPSLKYCKVPAVPGIFQRLQLSQYSTLSHEFLSSVSMGPGFFSPIKRFLIESQPPWDAAGVRSTICPENFRSLIFLGHMESCRWLGLGRVALGVNQSTGLLEMRLPRIDDPDHVGDS